MSTIKQVSGKPEQLGRSTVALHWLVAMLMMFLLASGFYMTTFEDYAWYSWHKSVGILALAIAIIRVIWQMQEGFPKPLNKDQVIQNGLAKLIHYALLICTVIMPVSGIISSAAGGFGVPLFGFVLIDSVDIAERPINGLLASIAHETHFIVGYIMVGIVLFHIIGALWHHFIKNDNVLSRMLNFKITMRRI